LHYAEFFNGIIIVKTVIIMKTVNLFILVIFALAAFNCGSKEDNSAGYQQQVEHSPQKDINIQRYNVAEERKHSGVSSPCDTFALAEYILNTYPSGSYLVTLDKTGSFSVPRHAVMYLQEGYVAALVATSRPGERLIELKNIVGYDQSFIDLDSTKLGTAFFYLTLFYCNNGTFENIWEVPVPNHGGFNNFSLERWAYKRTPYIKVNFHYARGIGHIDYNYFMVEGWENKPHLLMTYLGINFKRTVANNNNDEFPDYYEFAFYDFQDRITVVDSIPFIWDTKENVYVNTRNKKQTRPY
jgi:hypothetical protein